jgi:hypothetical protein
MIYKDTVYGDFEINDPIILDLIDSAAIQRLKDIDVAGYRPAWIKPDLEIKEYSHSRYSHSLGVYLLLRKYDAPLEEQIAGLIHDVSHFAFSHVIDYVLSTGSQKEQSHQDNSFEDYVKTKTDIPAILEKYGLDLETILDDKNFPLKETKLPDICADRIDYSLRDATTFQEIDAAQVAYLLDNLVVKNKQWVFKNFESAKSFAELFRTMNNVYYSGLPSAIMFQVVADCLKYALEKKYISEADLYTTDALVVDKIKAFLGEDDQLNLLWERMNNKISITNNPADYDITVFCKSRMIDPLCFVEGEVKHVSDVESSWGEIVKKESQPKQYFLKFFQ